MPYVRNWLHCVWGTKNRDLYLNSEFRYDVTNHIRENAKTKGIYIDSIDGSSDHLHCLFLLHHDMSLSKAMQLIKGESSFWINHNGLLRYRFSWAEEYYGVSVSESQKTNVQRYIRNQVEHHKKVIWDEEREEMIRYYGFQELRG
jgi:putative transposase